MNDDDYYHAFLAHHRSPPVVDTSWPERFHCAFHDVRRSRENRRLLRWPRCRICDGLQFLPAKRKRPAEDAGYFVDRSSTPCEGL